MAEELIDFDGPPHVKDHKREIFRRGGRYEFCQVLNWHEGEPPKYLICCDDKGHTFLANQAMGTWMESDLYLVAHRLNIHCP